LVRLDPQRVFESQHDQEIDQLIGRRPDAERGKPPLITFAVGGAGAQTKIVEQFLPSLRSPLERGRMRLALVAGVRREVADHFEAWISRNKLQSLLGGSIQILFEPDMRLYFQAFNRLMAETDVLWTKPSEMTFFGALGIALVLSPPVGAHERYNGRWAIEHGAGLRQREPKHAGEWLAEWLEDGTLAAAAWAGFKALPKHGLYKILEEVGRSA
jgi:UDP-N-acetylglucosamine:LPS N-acetylglucosamine transferase